MGDLSVLIKELIPFLNLIDGCLQKELHDSIHVFSVIQEERFKMLLIINFLRKKWILDIFYLLLVHDALFFNEIKENLPKISNNVLTQRLKSLQLQRIIAKREFTESAHHYHMLFHL